MKCKGNTRDFRLRCGPRNNSVQVRSISRVDNHGLRLIRAQCAHPDNLGWGATKKVLKLASMLPTNDAMEASATEMPIA